MFAIIEHILDVKINLIRYYVSIASIDSYTC